MDGFAESESRQKAVGCSFRQCPARSWDLLLSGIPEKRNSTSFDKFSRNGSCCVHSKMPRTLHDPSSSLRTGGAHERIPNKSISGQAGTNLLKGCGKGMTKGICYRKLMCLLLHLFVLFPGFDLSSRFAYIISHILLTRGTVGLGLSGTALRFFVLVVVRNIPT